MIRDTTKVNHHQFPPSGTSNKPNSSAYFPTSSTLTTAPQIDTIHNATEAASSSSKIIPGFALEKTCFRFSNNFVDSQYKIFGNTRYGLCGGMALAAMQYYKKNLTVPEIEVPPSPKNYPELFEYLKDCQFNSVMNADSIKYITLMTNDFDSDKRTICEEYPKIMTLINQDKPCLIGLIREKGHGISSLFGITNHHQVLAYGYTKEDSTISIHVYDPNHPLNKDMKIKVNQDGSNLTYLGDNTKPVYSFFKLNPIFDKAPPII
jgi:hypothetical protein